MSKPLQIVVTKNEYGQFKLAVMGLAENGQGQTLETKHGDAMYIGKFVQEAMKRIEAP